jgi:CheY-like chemotaxis protein
VAVSAYASSDDRQRALRAGFQEHLAKPVEIAQLVATVVRLADVDSAGPVPIEARRREPPNSRG